MPADFGNCATGAPSPRPSRTRRLGRAGLDGLPDHRPHRSCWCRPPGCIRRAPRRIRRRWSRSAGEPLSPDAHSATARPGRRCYRRKLRSAAGSPARLARLRMIHGGGRDTLRVRTIAAVSRARRSAILAGSLVTGYLSLRGLPPVAGRSPSPTRPRSSTRPIMRSARPSPSSGRCARRRARVAGPAVVASRKEARDDVYLIRVDNGLFETDAPGHCWTWPGHPPWLDRLARASGRSRRR